MNGRVRRNGALMSTCFCSRLGREYASSGQWRAIAPLVGSNRSGANATNTRRMAPPEWWPLSLLDGYCCSIHLQISLARADTSTLIITDSMHRYSVIECCRCIVSHRRASRRPVHHHCDARHSIPIASPLASAHLCASNRPPARR